VYSFLKKSQHPERRKNEVEGGKTDAFGKKDFHRKGQKMRRLHYLRLGGTDLRKRKAQTRQLKFACEAEPTRQRREKSFIRGGVIGRRMKGETKKGNIDFTSKRRGVK